MNGYRTGNNLMRVLISGKVSVQSKTQYGGIAKTFFQSQ